MDSISKQLLLGGGKVSTSGQAGQAAYTSPGTYLWTCPDGVYSVSAVCIGGGLEDSYFINDTTVCGKKPNYATGGGFVGDGGGDGGNSGMAVLNSNGHWRGGGGGGAGGYLGRGGDGGSGVDSANKISHFFGGGGGGVGIFGIGSTGSGAQIDSGAASGGDGGDEAVVPGGGGGGSGGAYGGGVGDGGWYLDGVGGSYGGGGGGLSDSAGGAGLGWRNNIAVVPGETYTVFVGAGGQVNAGYSYQRESGGGAVRIIWPGNQRQFPSTRTGDE